MSRFASFWSQNIRPLFFIDEPQAAQEAERGPAESNQLNMTPPTGRKGSILHKLRRYYQYRVELQMKLWRIAVATAEDMIRPRRFELLQVYHRAMEDDHLLSQVRTARFTVQMGDFSIVNNKQDDEALTELLERPWFDEYIQYAVDSELFGHSLVEFTPRKGPEFESLYLVPREHVRPEYGEIVLDIHAESGIPYRNGLIGKHLVEIGKPDDLGLLKVASKSIIRKDYALGDWSRRNEKYGMPFLVVKTASRNEEELKAKADMAANFGNNAWAVLDDQDEVEFKESSNQYAYQAYKDYAEKVDEYISKLINGQTGTTEEKAYVGSAEVHERILNTYTKARMRRIQYHINYCLLPFLRKHGYPIPEDAYFEYHDLRKQENDNPDNMDQGTSQAGDDPDDPKGDPPKGNNKLSLRKKKEPTDVSDPITALYHGLHNECCAHPAHQLNFDFDLDGIVSRAIRRVFQQKLQAGDVDAEAWRTNTEALWQALEEGADTISTDYSDRTSYETLSQLRRNVAVFAAFKNHRHVADLVEALTDDEGELRSWDKFKPIAEGISRNYFENWLRAEYETAVGTAQMAAKWADYQANADVLPMLQYVTQRDARVREAHRALDGVTLPLDDPFWEQYYPPNGWRCRCDVIQVAGPEQRPEIFPREDQVPPIFRHNSAKTLELFPQSHPYYKDVPNAQQKQNLIQATARLLYKSYDSNWTKIRFDDQSGGYLVRHKNTDAAQAIRGNVNGRVLAKLGEAVEILPTGAPDLSRNGLLWAATTKISKAEDLLLALQEAALRSERVLVNTKELTPELRQALHQAKEDQGIYQLQVLEGETLHNI